nr:energy-coupling factor transporter transmembrane component T [Planctomonas sp. JC2975]
MPTGRKTVLILALVLCVSLLPSAWWAATITAVMTVLTYVVAGLGDGLLGMRSLARQVTTLRWMLAITLASQLLFLGPEPAVSSTIRICAAVSLSALLPLTTRVTAILDAIEHGLRPLAYLRLDPKRAAITLTVAFTTIPALAGLAREVRDAQRARGARGSLRTFAVPFLVLASRHAFQLGDALTARGMR